MKLNIQKSKASYTVIVVSDLGGKENIRFHIRAGRAGIVVTTLFVLFVAMICYTVYISIILYGARESNRMQQEQISELNEAYVQLEADKHELEGKISALQGELSQKAQESQIIEAAKEENYIPRGFPADGVAYFKESASPDEGDDEEDEEIPADGQMHANKRRREVIFAMAANTNAVASGPGKVLSVSTDADEGNMISIDHGNGYISMYRSFSTPVVSEGSQVEAGDILYSADENGLEIGYSIRKDDTYVDPMEMIEANG